MSERSRVPWMLVAGLAGAGAMYLLDPDRGARRRHGLADRTRARAHAVEALAGKAQRDLRNRSMGLLARAKGSPPRRNRHGALSNGTPERRLLEGGAGLALALWGVVRGGLAGAGAGLAGASLLARAAVWRGRDHMIRVQKTMTLDAPLGEVFAFWARFENFPRFMSHVLEVRRTGPGRSHWRVTGPAGLPVEWDAEVITNLPERVLEWRSIDGSAIDHHGEIHFERLAPKATRVSIHMAYRPPGGALGHGVAAFLHGDPKALIDDDLLRMKSLLEHGTATARGVVTRRE